MPRKPVGNQFALRHGAVASAGGDAPRATLLPLDERALEGGAPQPYCRTGLGTLHVGDSLRWLASLPPASVDLAFADPPYSLGKAAWDEFPDDEAYLAWSEAWIGLAARALKPNATLYVCGFSEILADVKVRTQHLFHGCRWLVWHYRNKANLRHDWGRSHESILHFRAGRDFVFNTDDVRVPYGDHTLRYPVHPQAESSAYGGGKPRAAGWTPHPRGAKPRDVLEIPVTSNGMPEKTPHPTQKPEELLRRLILASSRPGDLVIDPFAGSGTTLVCAEQLGRRHAGCERDLEYCRWAAARLAAVPERTPEEWIAHDQEQARRRSQIR